MPDPVSTSRETPVPSPEKMPKQPSIFNVYAGLWGAQRYGREEAALGSKISDLIDKRKALIDKSVALKGTPEGEDTFNALKQVDADLRSIYNPQNNPNAIQKFGHLLTDHLGIKVKEGGTGEHAGEKVKLPQMRKDKANEKSKAAVAGNERQARLDVAAGPLSPEQQASTTGRFNLAGIQAQIKNNDTLNPHANAPDATPEEKEARQTYINSLIQNPKTQMGKWDRITGKIKGQPVTLLYNEKTGEYKTQTGESVPQEALDSFIPDPKEAKPGTSKFSMNVESYKKLHGITSDQTLTPDQLNFVEQQIALSSAAPSTNITTSLKQDINGMWVPVTEANRHVPGFGKILYDPLGKKGLPSNSEGGVSSTMSKPIGLPKVAPTPAAGVATKVGAPLFQGRTPAIAKAQNDVVDATKLYSIAKQVEAKPNDAFNQKRLAVQLERASAGRFTVQALDYVKQMGWGATLQEWANKPTTGALSPQLVRQLIDGAHENLKAAQDALKAAMTPIGESDGETPQTSGGKSKHYVGEVVKLKNGQTLKISVVHTDGSFE